MKRLYDFKCPHGHKFEEFIDSEIKSVDCPTCGNISTRLVSYGGPCLDHISGDFPGQTMKWSKWRQHKIKQERKEAQANS